MVICPHCGSVVPLADTCSACGLNLPTRFAHEPATDDSATQAGGPVAPDQVPVEASLDEASGDEASVAETPEWTSASLPPSDDTWSESDIIPSATETVADDATASTYGEAAADSDEPAEPVEAAPQEPPVDQPAKKKNGVMDGVTGIFRRSKERTRNASLPIGTKPLAQARNPYALVGGIGALLALLALLGNNAGIAIVIAVLTIPALAFIYASRLDNFEREPTSLLAATLATGFAVGIIVSAIAAWITGALWLEGATFHVGAAGFAGRIAELEGAPGFLPLLVNGIVIPAVTILAILASAVMLRRVAVFRNEIMDGVQLGAAAGGGFAAAAAVVYFWPLIADDQAPNAAISDWTSMLLGVVVLRPLLFAIIAAVLGAGLWHYLRQPGGRQYLLPFAGGGILLLVYSFVDLLVQPAGNRWNLAWLVVVLAAALFLARQVISAALAYDTAELGADRPVNVSPVAQPSVVVTATPEPDSVRCPNCDSLTPAGRFCQECGETLQ